MAENIIIDGCDVSGCEFYLPYSEKCECIVDDNGNNNIFCREYRDCYYKRMYHTGQEKDIYKNENKELYKQLKAKEQECEELKKYLNQIRDEELSHLDIEWNEYETSARKYDYSNIITLVERALGEIND